MSRTQQRLRMARHTSSRLLRWLAARGSATLAQLYAWGESGGAAWRHWREARDPATPPADPPTVEEHHTLVARGTGGRLELEGNCLRLIKGGTFGYFLEVMGIEGGFMEHTIRVSDISAVELDKPALFFRYIRFSYPGSPPMTGHDVKDMMAENALIMSLIDNRQLYRIVEEIERSMHRQAGP